MNRNLCKQDKETAVSDRPWKTYGKLFLSMLYMSAFTFGGGYVIISLMKRKFVDELHWIDENEMLNLTAIAQSAPGAVAVNAAILVGYKIAGVAGAAISIVATILPPLVILSVISVFYKAFRENTYVAAALKGMQAGVAAVIADVVVSMGGKIIRDKKIVSILVMPVAFIAAYFLNVNVIIVIACGAAIGVATFFIDKRRATA